MVSGSITILSSFPADFFIHWKDDVVNVRNLYRERKYRRCAVLCSKLLKEAIHPVHRTFLYFYQAICYESLGHIAHNYSSNKIPLFEQARDAFVSASESLPLAHFSTITGELETADASPMCATLDIAAHYVTPTASSIYPSPCPQTSGGQRSSTDSTAPIPSDQISRTYLVPNFEEYSPRSPFEPITPIRREPSPDFVAPDQHHTICNHKTQLSRTLSSQHALAEELIPSPLFSRGPSSKKESRFPSPTQSIPFVPLLLPHVALSRPLPPTPTSRPLPDLPFNHKPQFIRKGKRFVVVPRRKTALSTLISRFERERSFSDYTPLYSGAVDQGLVKNGNRSIEATPVTERFRKISAIFVEKEERSNAFSRTMQPKLKLCAVDNAEEDSVSELDDRSENASIASDETGSDKENINPSPSHGHNSKPSATASPTKSLIPRLRKPKSHLHTLKMPCLTHDTLLSPQPRNPNANTYTPTSTNLQPHRSPPKPPPPHTHTPSTNSTNSAILSLQPHLTTHLTQITSTILKTRELQSLHDQEKRARFLATYRRALSPSPSPSPSPTKSSKRTRVRDSRITPAKDARLRSFWSLQDAEGRCISTRRAKDNSGRIGTATDGNGHGNGADDEMTRRKRERIERLKASGWVVGKEKVGFKGVEYYERWRGVVEKETEEARSCELDKGGGMTSRSLDRVDWSRLDEM